MAFVYTQTADTPTFKDSTLCAIGFMHVASMINDSCGNQRNICDFVSNHGCRAICLPIASFAIGFELSKLHYDGDCTSRHTTQSICFPPIDYNDSFTQETCTLIADAACLTCFHCIDKECNRR